MQNLLKKIIEPFFVVALIFLKSVKRFITIRTFLGNQTLFGHLALEPEKYLCSKELKSKLNEIGFNGSKEPENIAELVGIKPKTKIVIDLWTFGKRGSQSNIALVKMWKRQVRTLPSPIFDVILKANDRFSAPPIIDYRFSTLLSAEKNLDCCKHHLEFSSTEIEEGKTLLRNLGIPSGAAYVCVVTREGGSEDGFLRNKDINDLSELIDALVDRGVSVIRLGGPNSKPLKRSRSMVIDYAHSEHKSALGDVYLVANCQFMVSTMTGPDALALSFRKNVLLLDIAHYGLLFSGTQLVTWVPAILNDGNKNMSIEEVFKSGAGWFWKDSQFREKGISVSKSSPTQIAEYGIELHNRLNSEQEVSPTELQKKSQTALQNAMGDLGKSWHGTVKARIPNSYLEVNQNWFLN